MKYLPIIFSHISAVITLWLWQLSHYEMISHQVEWWHALLFILGFIILGSRFTERK